MSALAMVFFLLPASLSEVSHETVSELNLSRPTPVLLKGRLQPQNEQSSTPRSAEPHLCCHMSGSSARGGAEDTSVRLSLSLWSLRDLGPDDANDTMTNNKSNIQAVHRRPPTLLALVCIVRTKADDK